MDILGFIRKVRILRPSTGLLKGKAKYRPLAHDNVPIEHADDDEREDQ